MIIPQELDEADLRILDAVQSNPPLSTAELAEKVGLSQSPCWRRLSRLKREGYLEEATTQLNAEKLGFGTVVFASVRLSAHGRSNLAEFTTAIDGIEEVVECHTVLGGYDFLLRVVARDVAQYRDLIYGKLSALPGVQEIHSTMSLGATKSTHRLPIRPKRTNKHGR